MKVFKLIILLLFLSFAGYAQTTPWATTSTTTQTRLFNGAKQIRWLWNSSYIYSLQDSINASILHVTANNGLTNNSGTIQLGGTPLNHNTSINTGSYYLWIEDAPNFTNLRLEQGDISMWAFNHLSKGSQISMDSTQLGLNYSTGAGNQSIAFNGSSMMVTDGINNIGEVNAADYSANFVPESHATKRYVDNAVSSAISVSGTITSSPSNGDTYSSLNGFVALFSKTNNPTGSLSGGNNYQRSASNVTHNLSYSYGRTNLNTNPIASAVINPGSFNVFSGSPAQGSSNSGTQSVTTTANTNTTYTIHIVTTDSKTADYSTSDNWFGNAYYGRAAGTAATSGEVLAAAGGGSPLAGSHAGSWTVIASGSNHPFIAIPATLGHITQFLDVNNFDVTSSFPETIVSITNTSSYTENYYVYTFVTATSSNYFFKTN